MSASPKGLIYIKAVGPVYGGRTAGTVTPPTYAAAFTIALSASSGATNSPVSGTVTPTGGPLSAAATVTLSCGTGTFADVTLDFASGATAAQAFSFTPTSDAVHSIAMTNTLALTNTGSPASYTSTTSAGLTVGAQIATLSVTSESGSGARPYAATVLPLRGQVPSGSVVSNAAGTEVGDILSTHDDGSAAVVVFASTATGTGTVALHVATGTPHAVLTAAAIAAAGLTSVAVAFGSPYGTASITDFSTPERVWWATSKVYCARYRVAAPTPGSTALEAVIDIHAWADRALVEVAVENAKMATTSPTKPAAASYTGATVSINGGAAVVTVNSADMPTEAAHSAFRGWYASGWVGAGSTGLRVTQLHTELQQHPLLFKCDQASTFNMAGYASDAYTPWSTGRQRATGMGSAGAHDSVGPLPMWEARALQSGDRRAWQATETSALALLGYNINYRDSTTGLPPTFAQLQVNNVSQNGYTSGDPQFWPSQSSAAMSWVSSHHPAAGLMAFVSRPSPVFIELAQKVAVWNGTYTVTGAGSPLTTGVFSGLNFEARARAWCIRSLAHSIFLTPDSHPWKTSAKTSLTQNVTALTAFTTDTKAKLNLMWLGTPASPSSQYNVKPTGAAFGTSSMQQAFHLVEVHKAASAGLLTGADQTALETLADWMATWPARWINEQPNGGWRYISIGLAMGRNPTTIDSPTTWTAMRAYSATDTPASVSGTWMTATLDEPAAFAADWSADTGGGTSYPAYFWSALVAAVERGVSGAVTAWNTVLSDITSIDTWRTGFATAPQWGSTPKNPPPPAGFATGGGTGTLVGDVWTPARAVDGRVYAESWDIVPTGAWYRIADTEMTTLTAEIVAAALNWNSTQLGWASYTQSWSGWAIDQTNARLWHTCSGGHSDGNNNGVYRFDCYKMKWAIDQMPTDRLLQNTEYAVTNGIYGAGQGSTNWTADFDAVAQFGAGTLGHINDSWYDQFMVNGQPGARHTYAAPMYDAARDKLYMPVRRWWEFNRASGTWDYRRIFNDKAHVLSVSGAYSFVPAMDASGCLAIWDEVADEALFSSSEGILNNSYKYNKTTATFGAWTAPWNGLGANTLARHGRIATVLEPPQSAGTQVGRYWRYDLDARSTGGAQGNLQLIDCVRADFVRVEGGEYDGAASCYVPSVGKYLMCTRTASPGPMAFYWINPGVTPWSISPATLTNAPTGLSTLLNGRMTYMEALDAIVMQDLASTRMYLYKF